jgi:hypothetical protein
VSINFPGAATVFASGLADFVVGATWEKDIPLKKTSKAIVIKILDAVLIA